MIKAALIKQSGEKSGDIELNDKLFGVQTNNQIFYQSLTAQLSNARLGNAHSKTRAEVSGGGKKPWKQKGTGNARAGSSRSPLWIGGGVTFGPRNVRNWHKRIPSSFKRQSILMALSDKVKNSKFIIVGNLIFDKISTKEAVSFLGKMPIKEGSILLVVEKREPSIMLSFRNLGFLKTVTCDNLNIYDIASHDYLIITKDALSSVEKQYLKPDMKTDKSKEKSTAEQHKAPVKPIQSKTKKTSKKKSETSDK